MKNFISEFDGYLDYLKAVLKSCFEPMKSFLGIFSNFYTGAVLIAFIFVLLLAVCISMQGKALGKQIKNTKTLTVCAMMIAINLVLEYLAQDLTAYIRISFAFVTLPIVSTLFGPIAGCMVGLLQDFAGFLIRPTGGYLFTLTINEGIAGMIFGLMLYKKKVGILRIFLAELIVILFVNIILNSAALAPTVGSGMAGILPSRIIKNIILLPIQTIVVYTLLKIVKKRIK